MSKGRISSHERSSREPLVGEAVRFLGVSLGGGKSDKACVAVIEYYPQHSKVFLSRIFEKIKNDENISADLKIHEIVEHYKGKVESIAYDVPWDVPQCLRCELKCPGYENCKESHIEWMWNYSRARNKKKKPRKIFTPYTQRCVEMYLASELEEVFNLNHALGSNQAPLLARAAFIHRRLHLPSIEVYPRLSIWRIGRSLNMMKSHLRFHRHALGGSESRRAILKELSAHQLAFVYEQDFRLMVENNHAFEAFICAFTAFLKYRKQTEPRPTGFPKAENWIEFPVKAINWKGL